MTLPLQPASRPESTPTRSARFLAIWISLGILAVVLLAVPSTLFDLDRFAVPKELALHLTAVGALLILAFIDRHESPSVVAVEVPLLAFAAWSVLSALFATNHWLSLRATALTVSGIVLFRAGRRVTEGGAQPWLLAGVGFTLTAGALTGLAQAYGFETWLLAESRAPGGTFGNRNFLAHMMAIGSPILILLTLATRGPRRAAASAVGLGIMIGAMVLTRSRAAWLGCVVSGMVMALAWLIARRGGRMVFPSGRLRLLAAAAVVGTLAALTLPNRLSWKSDSPYSDTVRDLTNYREGSGRGRLVQYGNSLRLMRYDPVFGTGPGNWPVKYPLVTTRGDPSFSGVDPMPTNPWPSSDWVAFITERGALGALLLLAAFGAMALTALRRLRAPDPAETRNALALLGVLTATMVTGAFDAVLLLAPPTILVWTAAGALLPRTGGVGALPNALRRMLLPTTALILTAGVLRSAGQVKAIATAGPGWPVERLIDAVRFDPGSFRLHLMIAQRTGCARARGHARSAALLFPLLPAPRRRLAACG